MGDGLRKFSASVFSPRMGMCIVLGFSSGMPLYVLITLLSAFLRKQGADLSVIGFFSLVMIPYTWKFAWAPLLDRFEIFGLGRRRGWILATQILLMLSIAMMGFCGAHFLAAAWLALAVAVCSATQDIAIDAMRREFLSDSEMGLGNSLFVNAYRIAGLVPGGLSLIIAQFLPWEAVFVLTALCLLPGFLITLRAKEKKTALAPRTLKAAVVEPWRDFIGRNGLSHALLIIAFVFFYKLGDSMATALATPFYIDLGYDLATIGIIAKNVGLWSTVAGGILGGLFMLRIGISRALWVFGAGQMVTIAALAILAHAGKSGIPSLWLFSFAVGAEALGSGLGTAAFVSYIASITNPEYTATQFAILTSLSAVPRTFCNAMTGILINHLGWENFFILCVILAIPGMALLIWIAPFKGEPKTEIP
ncbi:MAG: AmpG family muropeptide MFS transporter [Succinatimonas hippei]|nr:AmpG family muropeptide MFS transporter [Succinatimonas hippei]